jgi:hypothetical protein
MYIFAVFLTALATAGITYAIIAKPGFLPKSAPPSPGIPPAPGPQVASASPETGTQAKPSAPIPVIPPAPGQKDAPTAPGIDSPAKSSPPAPTTPPASRTKREAASVKPGAPSKPTPPAAVSPPAPGKRVVAVSPKPSPPAKPSSVSPADSPEPRRQVAPSPPSQEPTRGLQSGAQPEASKIPVRTDSRPPAIPPGDKNEIPKETSRETKVPPGKASKPGEPVAGSSAANPPPLKISGIVWNEEASKRRAVVNGSFATEGSVIEGVKVVEIFPTKVLFLHQGRYFEISVF